MALGDSYRRSTCSQTISVPTHTGILLDFSRFNLPSGDVLTITDGSDSSFTLGSYTLSDEPPRYLTSYSSSVTLSYTASTSQRALSTQGFHLLWRGTNSSQDGLCTVSDSVLSSDRGVLSDGSLGLEPATTLSCSRDIQRTSALGDLEVASITILMVNLSDASVLEIYDGGFFSAELQTPLRRFTSSTGLLSAEESIVRGTGNTLGVRWVGVADGRSYGFKFRWSSCT